MPTDENLNEPTGAAPLDATVRCQILERAILQMLELHDSFIADPSPENAYAMKDGFDMIRQSFRTMH